MNKKQLELSTRLTLANQKWIKRKNQSENLNQSQNKPIIKHDIAFKPALNQNNSAGITKIGSNSISLPQDKYCKIANGTLCL